MTSRNKYLQYFTQYPAGWSAGDYAEDDKKESEISSRKLFN